MNILLATYWVLPHVGGVSKYIQDLKRNLERRGHTVDVFARHPDGQSCYILNQNHIIDTRSFRAVVEKTIRHIYASEGANQEEWIIEQEIQLCCYALAALSCHLERYDLIHTQDVLAARAIWHIKPPKVPLISTIHGCLAMDYWSYAENKDVTTPIWKYACAREYYGAVSSDLTLVPTDWLRRTLAGYQVPLSHMQVIHYGMNVASFLQRVHAPPTLHFPAHLHKIVCSARLDRVKGHDSFIEALHLLKNVRSDWVCYLIGDGELRHELTSKVGKLGLQDHVVFLGNRDDVPSLLKQADIVVLPSLNDNHPYAVMEGQLAGKPVVASDAGGIPEMITHDQTGLLFRAGDAAALFHHLHLLMTNPALRQKLASQAQQWAMQHWSEEGVLEQTLAFYERVRTRQTVHRVLLPQRRKRPEYKRIHAKLRLHFPFKKLTHFHFVDDYILGSIIHPSHEQH